MDGASAVSSAVAVQRSRTQAANWRDANSALVRGGVLQVQSAANGHSVIPVLPSLGEPPSKLLLNSPSPEAQVKSESASIGRSSPVRSTTKSPENAALLSLALRERVEQTSELPDALKEECLKRLDDISIAMPPERKRRPSWIHDKNDEGFSTSMRSRGRKTGRGVKDSGSRTESSSSERSGGERGGSLQSLQKNKSRLKSGDSAQAERTLQAKNMSFNSLLSSNRGMHQYRRAKRPDPLPADLFSVDFGSTEDTRQQLGVGKSGRAPFLSPTASAVWKCTAKSSRPIPRALSHQNVHEAAESPQPLQSTKSVPELHKAPPPGEVIDARRAVAAARDALAPLPNAPHEPAQALPVRGMGSLLRTSLRYALQT